MADEMIPVDSGGQRQKPVGILDAVSEIQRYYVAESGGSSIPAEYFTLDMAMEYFWLGMKSVLHGGIFTILFMPVLVGVLQDKIHIFGHADATFLDRAYMFCMTLMFGFAYAFFYGYASKFNAGEVTKRMLLNLYGGVTFGSMIKMFVSIIVYHILYFLVFSEKSMFWLLNQLTFIKAAIRDDIYYWIKDTKEVLISSSLWVFFTCAGYIVICWIAYYTSENRKKSMEKGYGRK